MEARFEQRFLVVDDEATSAKLDKLARKTDTLTESFGEAGQAAERLEQHLGNRLGKATDTFRAGTSGQPPLAKWLAPPEVIEATDKAAHSVGGLAGEVGSLKSAAIGLGATFAAWGLQSLADEAAAGAFEIRKVALTMGVGVEAADNIEDAFTRAGLAVSEAGESVAKWSMAVRTIRSGAELPREMAAWGQLTKEQLASYPAALEAIAAKLRGVTSEQDKLILASGFFGESARKLLPLLDQGPEAIRQAASGDGAFYTEGIVRRSEEYRVKMLQVRDTWDDIKTTVAMELYPIIERTADRVMPVLSTGAEALSAALKFASENATLIEGALAGAAGYAATMSLSGGGGLLSGAASLLTKNPLLAGAAGIGSALFGIGSWMLDDLRSAGGQKSTLWEDAGREFAMAESRQRAEARRAEAEAAAAKAAERETEALAKLTKATGLTAEQLGGLGMSASQLVSDFQAGGQAIKLASYQARAAEAGAKADAAEQDVEFLRRVGGLVGRVKAAKGSGTYADLEREFEAGERAARIRALEMQGGTYVLGRGRLPAEQEKDIEAARYAIRALRLAEAEAERAKLTKLLESGRPLVQNNFNGPISNQFDLRGEDPDRVAFAVTEGMAKAARERTTSRFTPVGVQ